MNEQYFFKLQPSEATIASMASRIFSSYVAAGKVTVQTEKAMLDKSIELAILMARKVDMLVDSDEERSEEAEGLAM